VAPRITAPQAAPRVVSPRLPAVRPSAPALSGRPPQSRPGQTTAINRTQIRQLRSEESVQVRQLQAQQRQHLRDLRTQGQRPDSGTLRQLRAQNAQQLRDLRQQFGDRRLGLQNPPQQAGALRPDGRPRMTPESARQGRFASHFSQHVHPARWRADRIAAPLAWRRHHHAGFVAWGGALFWPHVYTDLFYYPFWPAAYDDAYWPDVYDDFFDGIYWATGNPYSAYTYAAPTAVSVSQSEPSRRRRQAGGAAADLCGSGGGATGWPFARIESFVQPTAEQQAFLDELKAAATQAADQLKASCPQAAALTPTGRIEAMIARLQATFDATRTVHVPLMKFYDSLSDEQKARFNAIGPNAGPNGGTAELPDANTCSGKKPGLADLPIERIEDAVRPSDAQQAKLDQLSKANDQAITILQAACPDDIPQTPVGRVDAIEKRLDAMIQAARTIQPALQDFYGSLTDEQKSRFNTLDQEARR
jgi:LTXXQ motif family protein